jgi:hypothetical protein
MRGLARRVEQGRCDEPADRVLRGGAAGLALATRRRPRLQPLAPAHHFGDRRGAASRFRPMKDSSRSAVNSYSAARRAAHQLLLPAAAEGQAGSPR